MENLKQILNQIASVKSQLEIDESGDKSLKQIARQLLFDVGHLLESIRSHALGSNVTLWSLFSFEINYKIFVYVFWKSVNMILLK